MPGSQFDRHFLYPLNSATGHVLEGANGPLSADPDGFEQSRSEVPVATWLLATNYRKVDVGDPIWVYFTSPHSAIGGVGFVAESPELNPETDRYEVRIEWDDRLCAQLGNEPIRIGQRVFAGATTANAATVELLETWLSDSDPPRAQAQRTAVKFAQREVEARLGQGEFRASLLAAYGGQCALTGEALPHVLQAAHIEPVAAGGSHDVSNGLLLRADIHNLFDAGLVAVASDRTLIVSRALAETSYEDLAGQPIRMPARRRDAPRQQALDAHRRRHRARLESKVKE